MKILRYPYQKIKSGAKVFYVCMSEDENDVYKRIEG